MDAKMLSIIIDQLIVLFRDAFYLGMVSCVCLLLIVVGILSGTWNDTIPHIFLGIGIVLLLLDIRAYHRRVSALMGLSKKVVDALSEIEADDNERTE